MPISSGIIARGTWNRSPRVPDIVRILVTGASGFAGLHLITELAKSGEHEITAGMFGGASESPPARAFSGCEWVSLDITSDESVQAAVRGARPDQIYHLAGQASVGESFRSPLPTWDVNATGTLRLLESVRLEGLSSSRVLVISSAEVYGAVPEADQPITESHPLRPVTPYGASKAGAEILGLQFSLSRSCEVVVSRSFNHIGPGQDTRFVLPSFARQLMQAAAGQAEPILRVGNLDVRRDFLDVRDAVRGYIAIMERGEPGGTYNVCSGRTSSLGDVVRRMVELSGTNARLLVESDRVRPVDIPALTGSSARLRALGWEPVIPLDDTLRDLLEEATAACVDG